MSKSISYHTRQQGDGKKLTGGSFGGAIDQGTVERITRLFSVRVKPSGTAVFVDDKGRDISLYFHIDPKETEKGKKAIREHEQQEAQKWKTEQEERTKKEAEIKELMNNLSHEEILKRLKYDF